MCICLMIHDNYWIVNQAQCIQMRQNIYTPCQKKQHTHDLHLTIIGLSIRHKGTTVTGGWNGCQIHDLHCQFLANFISLRSCVENWRDYCNQGMKLELMSIGKLLSAPPNDHQSGRVMAEWIATHLLNNSFRLLFMLEETRTRWVQWFKFYKQGEQHQHHHQPEWQSVNITFSLLSKQPFSRFCWNLGAGRALARHIFCSNPSSIGYLEP